MSISSRSSSDPESLNALKSLLPSLSPANLARYHSRGMWVFQPHLKPLNEQAVRLATGATRRAIWVEPPRWGKSTKACYFGAWFLGVVPNAQIIITSAEAELAIQWSKRIREIVMDVGQEVFGIGVKGDSSKQDHWETTAGGTCHAAGAQGPLTGRGATLILADDLIKSSEQANSEAFRRNLMDWWHSTLMTRLEPGGRILLIGTRWRVDDVVGQLKEEEKAGGDKWEMIILPALDENGQSTSSRFTAEELLQRKAALGEFVWETMYQGRPFVREGNFFRTDRLEVVTSAPSNLIRVRGWDEASSPTGDYTVGCLLGRDEIGTIYILDCVFGKWTPGRRDDVIKATVQRDGSSTRQHHQQEPGSAGVSRIEAVQALLKGYWITSDKPTGDKQTRAGALAAAIEGGFVKMLEADWNREFLEQLRSFPNGRNDDIPDAASWAYEALKNMSAGFSALPAAEKPKPAYSEASDAHPGQWADDEPKPGDPFYVRERSSRLDGLRTRNPFPWRR